MGMTKVALAATFALAVAIGCDDEDANNNDTGRTTGAGGLVQSQCPTNGSGGSGGSGGNVPTGISIIGGGGTTGATDGGTPITCVSFGAGGTRPGTGNGTGGTGGTGGTTTGPGKGTTGY